MKSLVNLALITVAMVLILLVAGCQQQPAPVPITPSLSPALAPAQTPTPIEEQKPETTPSSKPILKEGWTLHSDPEKGFAIALPSKWKVVTEEKTQPDGGARYLFYAVDPVYSTPVLDVDGSFSIVRASLKQEVSLALFEEREVRGLEADPTTVKPVSTRRVKLLVGEAMESTYTKNYPHRTGPVVFIQYAHVRGKELYILTSETTPNLLEKYRPIFEKMAHSFRLLTDPPLTMVPIPLPTISTATAEEHFYRGLAHLDGDRYDEAIIEFTRTIELDPYCAVAYVNRGIAYRQKGMSDQAIADFNRAIKLDPTLAKAYCNRGLTYDDTGEYDQAIADFNKAIELNPNYVIAYFNRAITYSQQGEYDKAIIDFEKCIELSDDPSITKFTEDNLKKLKEVSHD